MLLHAFLFSTLFLPPIVSSFGRAECSTGTRADLKSALAREGVALENLSICLRLDKLKSSNLSVVFCSIHSKQRENPKNCCAIGADLRGSSAHLLAARLSL